MESVLFVLQFGMLFKVFQEVSLMIMAERNLFPYHPRASCIACLCYFKRMEVLVGRERKVQFTRNKIQKQKKKKEKY